MERIKKHVDKTPHLTQKAFLTEIITKALDEMVANLFRIFRICSIIVSLFQSLSNPQTVS